MSFLGEGGYTTQTQECGYVDEFHFGSPFELVYGIAYVAKTRVMFR